MRVGCTDALCHVSQIGDDKFSLSTKNRAMLIGKDSHKILGVGDRVRAKTIKASVDHVSMKIAVGMKQRGLGPVKWREEESKTASTKKKAQ